MAEINLKRAREMAKKRGEENGTIQIPVSFGKVTIGENTASISFGISRANISVSKADKMLCFRRLTGVAHAVMPKTADAPGQQFLDKDAEGGHEIEGTFDVKAISCKAKNITAGLAFSLKDVEVAELAAMAKRDGWIRIEKNEPLDGEDADDDDYDSEAGD